MWPQPHTEPGRVAGQQVSSWLVHVALDKVPVAVSEVGMWDQHMCVA